MMASNNWVVSGRRTASGKPILASDPHLEGNRLPSVWYEIVLRSRDRYLLGGSIPGAVVGATVARGIADKQLAPQIKQRPKADLADPRGVGDPESVDPLDDEEPARILGAPVAELALQAGDELQIGGYAMRVEMAAAGGGAAAADPFADFAGLASTPSSSRGPSAARR